MAKKNDAKRAAKKHAKEKKRQKKLAARPTAPYDPIDRWNAAATGIEGLARLLKTDSHHAAIVADLLALQNQKGAAATWHPARVRALPEEVLLAELAKRGVVTDEASFAALATRYDSARVLAAENWGPAMAPDATPHDRDLVGEAAEVLWSRWGGDKLSDEQLADRVGLLLTAWEDGDADATIDDLFAAWESVRERGGLARIDRAAGSGEGFVATVLDAIEAYDEDDAGELPPLDRPRALRVVDELRAELPVGTQTWVGTALTHARLLVDEMRPLDAIEGLLARAAEQPSNPALPMEAVELYGAIADDLPDLHARIAAAVAATRDAGPPKFRDLSASLLAYLEQVRANRSEPSAD